MTPERYLQSRLGQLIKHNITNKHIFTGIDSSGSFIRDDELREFHHYYQADELARTYYEPFKGHEKSNRTNMIYSAVMSSVKATLFNNMYGESHEGWLGIFYPLIIFSGDLYKARVKSDKSVELESADHVQLSFHYTLPIAEKRRRSTWGRQLAYIVDIVHEDHLDQFLAMIESEHSLLKDLLSNRLECLAVGTKSNEADKSGGKKKTAAHLLSPIYSGGVSLTPWPSGHSPVRCCL